MVQLIVAFIMLAMIKALDLNYYSEKYDRALSTFLLNKKNIQLQFIEFNITITNIKAIRQSMNIDINLSNISFNNVEYSYIFNIDIFKDNGMILRKYDLIAEHTYDSLIFTLDKNDSFLLTFDHQETFCDFYSFDIFDIDTWGDLTLMKNRICAAIVRQAITATKTYVYSTPLGLDAITFWNIIIEIEKHPYPYNCNYVLNNTHILLGFEYNTIKYDDIDKNDLTTIFNKVNVTIRCYTQDDKNIFVTELISIIFAYMKYGNNIFEISNEYEGRSEFVPLLIEKLLSYFKNSNFKYIGF